MGIFTPGEGPNRGLVPTSAFPAAATSSVPGALLNNCRFTASAGGLADWIVTTAVPGYQLPSQANVVNYTIYDFFATSSDGSQWEIARGPYVAGTFLRNLVLYNSAGTGSAAGQTGVGSKINFTAAPQVAIVVLADDFVRSFNGRQGAIVPVAGDYPVSLGGTGTTNLTGLYAGLQPLKLGNSLIGVNPGTFANASGTSVFSTTAVLTADLSTASINTNVSPPVGGMISGALSTSGSTTDGIDVMLYLVARNSDGLLALVGDNSNVYSGSLAAVISNTSNSWSTGGPQTGFWNGTKVRLTGLSIPVNFAANTDYFVVSETSGQNSTSFGLSATLGGAPITAGSNSLGVTVQFGVQQHLDAIFGPGVWTVLRRVHFAFRWKWQWTTSSGGIPDFTCDSRSDRVTLTYGGPGFALTVPSSGTATSYTSIDCSSVLSNLNRIGQFRAVITSTGTAGTAFLSAPSNPGSDKPLGEGPVSGVTTTYGTAEVQTDSSSAIQYKVTGGTKLNALYLEGWTFVDPS